MDTRTLFWDKMQELKYESLYAFAQQLRFSRRRKAWTIALSIASSGVFLAFLNQIASPMLLMGVSFLVNCLAIALPYFEYGVKVETLDQISRGLQRIYDKGEMYWFRHTAPGSEWTETMAIEKLDELIGDERFFLDSMQALKLPHNQKDANFATEESKAHMEKLAKTLKS